MEDTAWLVEEIARKLGLKNPREHKWRAFHRELRPDLVVADGAKQVLVAIKAARAGVQDVALLVFWREFFENQNQLKRSDARLVLASRSITGAAENLLETMASNTCACPQASWYRARWATGTQSAKSPRQRHGT